MTKTLTDYIEVVARVSDILSDAWDDDTPVESIQRHGHIHTTFGPEREVNLVWCEDDGEITAEVENDPSSAMYAVLGYLTYRGIQVAIGG